MLINNVFSEKKKKKGMSVLKKFSKQGISIVSENSSSAIELTNVEAPRQKIHFLTAFTHNLEFYENITVI